MTTKPKKCAHCGKLFTPKYLTTEKYCSFDCSKANAVNTKKPQKPINKLSKKRQVEELRYKVLRIEFLGKKENQICPITNQQAIEVHHTYCGKDRAKYYLDVSTWLAVSRDGHNWIHDNPKKSRELGFLK